jgi:hypothetical protein
MALTEFYCKNYCENYCKKNEIGGNKIISKILKINQKE